MAVACARCLLDAETDKEQRAVGSRELALVRYLRPRPLMWRWRLGWHRALSVEGKCGIKCTLVLCCVRCMFVAVRIRNKRCLGVGLQFRSYVILQYVCKHSFAPSCLSRPSATSNGMYTSVPVCVNLSVLCLAHLQVRERREKKNIPRLASNSDEYWFRYATGSYIKRSKWKVDLYYFRSSKLGLRAKGASVGWDSSYWREPTRPNLSFVDFRAIRYWINLAELNCVEMSDPRKLVCDTLRKNIRVWPASGNSEEALET